MDARSLEAWARNSGWKRGGQGKRVEGQSFSIFLSTIARKLTDSPVSRVRSRVLYHRSIVDWASDAPIPEVPQGIPATYNVFKIKDPLDREGEL
jgi:hypothetical protein